MRFFTSFAVGLPLLAVSAVVGFASIQGISRQVVSLTAVDAQAPVAPQVDGPITPQAAAFAGAGLSGWTVPDSDRAQTVRPQTALLVAQTAQLLGVDISASTVPKPRPMAPVDAAVRESVAPEPVIAPLPVIAPEPLIIVTQQPVASAALRVPVAAPAARPAATRSLKPKPDTFRMPWQTGVFQ